MDILGLFSNAHLRRLNDADVADMHFTGFNGQFTPHYRKHILPKLREYDQRRIDTIRSLRWRGAIALPAALATTAVTAWLALFLPSEIDPQALVMMGVAPPCLLTWWTLRAVDKYKTSVKAEIYPLIFSFFGPDFRHQPTSPVSVRSLIPSGIIPDYDKEETGDYVRGTYKGVPIELFEAELTEVHRDSKGRETRTTAFKGVYAAVSANKRFRGRTLIRRDMGLLNWALGAFQGQGLEKVALEDPAFEKTFEVYATDQVEARYLLTTSFMDRLLKLTALFGNAALQGSFYGNRLLLGIPARKDYFKTGSIFKPATFEEEINTVLEEMKTFFEIIDTLKLDEKTGL